MRTDRLPFMLGLSPRTLLIGGIMLVVALVAGVLSAGPGGALHPTSAGAQAAATPTSSGTATTLNVVGATEERHAPDMAIVSLGVHTTGTTAAEASNTNNETMTAVIAAIKATGIADQQIQSTSISLTPVYSWPSDNDNDTPPKITGYEATNTVSVRVLAIDRLGSVLDAGLGAGANQLAGVSFALQDQTQPYLDALATATQEARRKAEAIAAAAGMVVGGIIEISEETAGAPQPFLARAASFAEAATASVPVQAGEIVVAARVRVQFRLEAAPAA